MARSIALAAALALAVAAASLPATAAPQELAGHGGPVMAAAAAGPDALTGSFDNTVGLWREAAGPPLWLEGHTAAVKTVLALPDGRAASGGDDLTAIIWDLESGEALGRLEGHNGSVAALAVSEDGTTLASAGWDARIGLWDLESLTHIRWLTGHDGIVNDVAFAAGRLYSASADGSVRIWDPATGEQERALVRHGFAINRLIVDGAAGWLAYGAVDGGTRAVRLSDGTQLADLTLGRRPILALARHGDSLAVGDGEGHVMVVDIASWSVASDFRAAAKGPVWALAFVGDGTELVAGGIDNAAYVLPAEGVEAPVMAAAPRSFQRAPETMSNGERQFQRKCSVCHTLTGDGGRRAGPTLANVFGRPAGAIPGFRYSPVLTDSTIVWSATTLDALFDVGPDHYIPGSNMPMQQIVSEADRRDLIEFLEQSTVE